MWRSHGVCNGFMTVRFLAYPTPAGHARRPPMPGNRDMAAGLTQMLHCDKIASQVPIPSTL